jgi:hypothetical protein
MPALLAQPPALRRRTSPDRSTGSVAVRVAGVAVARTVEVAQVAQTVEVAR